VEVNPNKGFIIPNCIVSLRPDGLVHIPIINIGRRAITGKLRHHLLGRPFSVQTDNIALKWLHSKKAIGEKLAMWILALQEFDLEIGHLKENQNVAADALYRYSTADAEETEPMKDMVCSVNLSPAYQESTASPSNPTVTDEENELVEIFLYLLVFLRRLEQ